MTPEKTIKAAIHCLGVQAEHEVCEECPVYLDGGIACREAARVAIEALKEIQLYKDNKLCLVPEDVYSRQCCELDAYKEIGTVDECREAVEKQKSVKPIDYDEDLGYFECPSCGLTIMADVFSDHAFCLNCGQKLNWDENLEGMEDV